DCSTCGSAQEGDALAGLPICSFSQFKERIGAGQLAKLAYRAPGFAAHRLYSFLRDLRAFFASLGKADGDGLLAALGFAAFAALLLAALVFVHRVLDFFAGFFSVLGHADLPGFTDQYRKGQIVGRMRPSEVESGFSARAAGCLRAF